MDLLDVDLFEEKFNISFEKKNSSESVISFSSQDCLRDILIFRKNVLSVSIPFMSSDAGDFVSFRKGSRLTVNSCMKNTLV